MTFSRPAAWVACGALLVTALLAPACGGDPPADSAAAASSGIKGEVVVFAASSLTEAFEEAGKAFEQSHPGTKVVFNFAASSALAAQVAEGARADVFASADEAQLQVVVAKGIAAAPQPLTSNTPVVVVPKGSGPVASFADLAKPGIRLVLAGKDVPIGKYARQVLANASQEAALGADFSTRVLANLRSEEANVRAVLVKVQLGEADAGIVYTTDLAAAGGDVTAISIPPAYNVVAHYPVASLEGGKNRAGGEAFVAFLLSDDGQQILARHGFGRGGA